MKEVEPKNSSKETKNPLSLFEKTNEQRVLKRLKRMDDFAQNILKSLVGVDEEYDVVARLKNARNEIYKIGAGTPGSGIINVEYFVDSNLGLSLGDEKAKSEIEFSHRFRIEKHLENAANFHRFGKTQPTIIDFDNFMRGNPHIQVNDFISYLKKENNI